MCDFIIYLVQMTYLSRSRCLVRLGTFWFNRGHLGLTVPPRLYRHLYHQLIFRYLLFLAFASLTRPICFLSIRNPFCFLPNCLISCSPYMSLPNKHVYSSSLVIYPHYISPSPKLVHRGTKVQLSNLFRTKYHP